MKPQHNFPLLGLQSDHLSTIILLGTAFQCWKSLESHCQSVVHAGRHQQSVLFSQGPLQELCQRLSKPVVNSSLNPNEALFQAGYAVGTVERHSLNIFSDAQQCQQHSQPG